MSIRTLLLAGSAFALVACGNATTSTQSAVIEDTVVVPAVDMAEAEGAYCEGFGPQTPRDISLTEGVNAVEFPLAPPSTEMNLCNIHTHTNAEFMAAPCTRRPHHHCVRARPRPHHTPWRTGTPMGGAPV